MAAKFAGPAGRLGQIRPESATVEHSWLLRAPLAEWRNSSSSFVDVYGRGEKKQVKENTSRNASTRNHRPTGWISRPERMFAKRKKWKKGSLHELRELRTPDARSSAVMPRDPDIKANGASHLRALTGILFLRLVSLVSVFRWRS